jgi:hypothetical protein
MRTLPCCVHANQTRSYACGYTSGGETDFGNRFAIPDKSPLTLELGKIVQVGRDLVVGVARTAKDLGGEWLGVGWSGV